MYKLFVFVCLLAVTSADLLTKRQQQRNRAASLANYIKAKNKLIVINSLENIDDPELRKHPAPKIGTIFNLLKIKPLSACCDIPELGNSKPLTECSNPKLPGPCNDVQCVFEKSGFLVNNQTLNKDAYKNHLRQWSDNHKGWSDAVDKAIQDCVDRDIRQYLDFPCKAYDVFTCTGIAMLKKCPNDAWKC